MEREPLLEELKVVSPAILQSSLRVGAATGLVGLCIGGIAGTVKRTTPFLFAVVSGLQCSAIGSTFWATRSFANVFQIRKSNGDISSLSSRRKLESSTFAGCFTGGFLGFAMRGTQNVMPGMVVFSSVGFVGQYLVNAYQRRIMAAQERPAPTQSLMERILTSPYFPMRKLSDAEYENMLQEKLLHVEAEIALLDENIEKAKNEQASATGKSATTSQDAET